MAAHHLHKAIFSLGLFLVSSSSSVLASEDAVSRTYQSYWADNQSAADQVNGFTVGTLGRHKPVQTVRNARLIVRLLQPLNSSFLKGGESVQAEVVSSALANGSPWLPSGTILSGEIERSRAGTYGSEDGSIAVRFYTARAGSQTIDLNTAPSTSDSQLRADRYHRKTTTKDKVRSALMTASFIAIPMAIGTGGMSIAISAGAGAVIGGVLADDHKYVQGAVSGAWEGTPLRVLDPLVRKGRNVQIPADTELGLRISEPARVPTSVIRAARQQQRDRDRPEAVALNTQAKLIVSKPPDIPEITRQYNTLVEHKNLASALSLLDKALKQSPDCEALEEMRQHVLEEVTGKPEGPGAVSNPGLSDKL